MEKGSPITFIKNNKIITITGPYYQQDDGFEKTANYSKELTWAFDQISYLEQQIPIEPIKSSEYKNSPVMSVIDDFSYFHFKNKDKKELYLPFTEIFYLWTELLHAKEADVDFSTIYEVCFNDNKHIQTDGRYYRFKTKKGETVTLDFGFNFIEENDLAGKFEDRNMKNPYK